MRRFLLTSLLLSGSALASTVIGPTYPIVEPDTAAEIKSHAAAVDWHKYFSINVSQSAAMQSASLPRAARDGSYLFDPTYELPRDIIDAKGHLLYPAGFKINVYERITMPGRMIVIENRKADVDWLNKVAKPTANDKILLAGGNVFTARESSHLNLLLLDQRFIERFGLRAVPSIVSQEGHQLRVREYEVH